MISIEEDQNYTRIRNIGRGAGWSRGRKETHHSFFRNNSQGEGNPNESRMSETLGKLPRQQPMKCCGCEGDRMYRYFPHRGEKVRIVHNVQLTETIEDMGISMPRIYAALDNKEAEFESHMIEVEGKINDQPISIFIDSRYIHNYIDHKMVERFHLTRSELGETWLV
jgi:hypothetical protein